MPYRRNNVRSILLRKVAMECNRQLPQEEKQNTRD
jgi:hypothetical protein